MSEKENDIDFELSQSQMQQSVRRENLLETLEVNTELSEDPILEGPPSGDRSGAGRLTGL